MFFKKRQPINPWDAQMAKLSQTAIQYGVPFGKALDYSPASLSDLEEILEYYHQDSEKNCPTENQLWSMALIFGAYLGETLLKNGMREKGFFWDVVDESNIPVLKKNNSSYASPVHKVYKRFVNGSEDSIVSFYDVSLTLWQ